MPRKKSSFTLLEVMIAIAIMAIAGSAIAWKLQKMVAKKQFQSAVERLEARFMVSHKLAMATQSDWQGVFKKGVFETKAEEGRKFSQLPLKGITVWMDGKVVDEMAVDFFASGKILPEGELKFVHEMGEVIWSMPKLFQKEEGKKEGPIRPENLRK